MKIENGELLLNIHELLSSLSSEQLNEIIDTLAIQEAVIEQVTNQIVDGSTSLGSYGLTGDSQNASTALDRAIRRIAESSSDIAKKEIEKLVRRANQAEELMEEAWAKTRELEKALQNDHRN